MGTGDWKEKHGRNRGLDERRLIEFIGPRSSSRSNSYVIGFVSSLLRPVSSNFASSTFTTMRRRMTTSDWRLDDGGFGM